MAIEVTRRDLLATAVTAGVALQWPAGAFARPVVENAPGTRANFDRGWRFRRGDADGAQAPGYADDDWSAVDLPHDWSIAGPFAESEASGPSGGYAPTGVAWYRKRFQLPAAAASQRVLIQFDGIYQRGEVWINGKSLGMRPNGYVSVVHDLTPHLTREGVPNTLAVRVDNSLQPNSRWYSGSGIYRHTWLLAKDPVHIAPWGIHIRTTDNALASVTTRVANAGKDGVVCTLRTEIVDPDGQVAAHAEATARIAGGAEHRFAQSLRLVSPRLWLLESPSLHTARTTVLVDGMPRDVETATFGVRDAVFDIDRGFLLNGRHVKLNGVCLHADGGAVGAAVPERVWERRLEILKSMGCNAIRCSHNPPAAEFLDLCDRLGFLVMAEPFDEWREAKVQTPAYGYHRYFDDWWQRDLVNMIERDRNHPSIVIWSAGNEVPDQKVARGPQTLQALLDVFHAMDPSRPVTVACDNIAAEPQATLDAFLRKLDVVGYNYVDRWRDRREKFYAIDRHDNPGRRFIGTESTGMGGVRGAYEEASAAPTRFEPPQNRRIAVEQLQKFIQTYDYVSGDFIWTGIDYLGESRWPNRIAAAGAIDTCGFPKDSFYFYQSLWTDRTVLHLSPHWNWAGREGEMISVTCYTNCDTVELFLNGKSLGVKGYAFPRPGMVTTWGTYPPRGKALQTTADLHLSWDVPYAPGVLRAVGVKGDQGTAVFEVKTAGPSAALRLSVDRDRIGTGPADVAHVTVEVVDADGIPVPVADNEIMFALAGHGKVLAVDNGRPDSLESYQVHQRRAYRGLALAILQAVDDPGEMTLTASSPGLADAKINITAEGTP